MRKIVCILFFCTAFCTGLFAADIKTIGVPYIQNYPKSIYGSGNQNWSVTQGKSGMMYFGNAEGLLVYDGRYWQQYNMPHRQIVRSVATDGKGHVYTGSYGDFGYWAFKNNRFSYNSLTGLIPGTHNLTDEIWKIYVDGDRVIFQSFSTIYIYRDQKIAVIKVNSPYLFLHKVNNRFFVEGLNRGLFELIGDKLSQAPGSEKIHSVLSILPYKGDRYLVGTSKDGLFIYDGKTFTPFQTPANTFLQTYQLNNGTRVLNKYYAYGTILNGLIIIDEDGRVIQQINKNSGLQNNTVLSLYADSEQNLWAGLDNGIDRIELNSPLYFYFDKTGKFGTVYSSIIFNDKIYLGTNQGLFYSNWTQQNNSFNFQIIPNSQGQVWDLSLVDGQLLCGHNSGTFKVAGNTIGRLSSQSGGWTIKRLNSAPNYMVQGTYNGLALYQKAQNGNWGYVARVEGFNEPSRHVEEDSRGEIWVSHAYKGLNKLTLSPDLRKVVANKYFDEKNGLPGNYNINVFNLENKIVFSSDSGFYTYDELSDRFSKYNVLNKKLGSFATSNKIISAGKHLYWFINNGKVALVDFSHPGELVINSNVFSVLDGHMVQYYENISRISDNLYLISVDDGFVIYNTGDGPDVNPGKLRASVLIRRIEDITDKYKIISENGSNSGLLQIPYNRDNIRIAFALPYYRQANIRFQYYLSGYSNDWSDWTTATQKDFTNLSAGTYQFKVRARINNALISDITVFDFEVLPPWYATKLADLVYLIMAIAALFIGKKVYERKLQRDHQKIADRIQKEQDEVLRKEAEENEKRIARLETEKLHTELESKSRELANTALSLTYKNEILQKLSEELLKVKDSSGKKLPEIQLNKIQKVINEGMDNERDWNLFEKSFNEAHENFFKKLSAHHPHLVPNDLKLCAYLRMNMSSKELASLLNITLRGVEIRRYRLRKKLDIPHDTNLVKFLMEL
ncbi:transcriptional regulator [Mucilaginibacter mali]|uniref:Transcriptional regulator n=1 Tax=Mucilaginibacter mali TaxID=2740462 RepID=A0A7D4Q8B1_9SPHI|nr:triple tyrosine motif-containing protein [Mucilaginibacter mali]QKJ30671.1 transcriptional regulator [Mucilaginibacter mali]